MKKEFYKNGLVYKFEINRMYCGIEDREIKLLNDGFIPVFDARRLMLINGHNGSLIIENDTFAPTGILTLQNFLKESGFGKSLHTQIFSIHPNHILQIRQLIDEKKIKNIIIDSLFKDIEQFRFLIKHLFSFYTELNFLINSHGTLINILNDECNLNMGKYEMRNSFYTYGKDNIPYFNDLTFVLLKNHVYEIEGDLFKKIDFKATYYGIGCQYANSYKFITEPYEAINEDSEPKQKSIWTE